LDLRLKMATVDVTKPSWRRKFVAVTEHTRGARRSRPLGDCYRPGSRSTHRTGASDSNRSLSGLHSRQFAPCWASTPKNPANITKKVLENGADWRFSEGQSAIFAVLGADSLDRNLSVRQKLTSAKSGCVEPPRARWGAIFQRMGKDGHVKVCRDLTIAPLLKHAEASPRAPDCAHKCVTPQNSVTASRLYSNWTYV
jgi:hypothetical protein